MATISQRIALEGGEEIRRQLEALGKTGKFTFEEIDRAALAAAQQLNRFVQAVAGVERSFAGATAAARGFGAAVSGTIRSVDQFGTALGGVVRNLALFAAGIAAGNLGFLKFITSASQSVDNLQEMAAGLGLTVEQFRALSGAAADSGISQEQFARGMTRLNDILAKDAVKQLDAAKERVKQLGLNFPPTKEGAETAAAAIGKLAGEAARLNAASKEKLGRFRFAPTEEGKKGAEELTKSLGIVQKEAEKTQSILEKLGISAIDPLTGEVKNLGTAFLEFAKKFSALDDGPQKIKLLKDAFGLFGRRFADLLADPEKIERLGKALRQLELPKSVLDAADSLNRSMLVLGRVSQDAKNRLALLFAPDLERLAGAMTDAILRNFDSLESGLNTIINEKIRPLINDLILLLQGGPQDESQLEVFEKRLFGVQKSIEQIVTGIAQAIRTISAAVSGLVKAFEPVAIAINKIFGTEFTGATLLATAAILKFLGVFGLITAGFKIISSTIGLVVRGFALLANSLLLVGRAAALLRFLPLLLLGLGGLPGLIAAAVAALGIAIFTFWDEIKAGATAAWEFIKDTFTAGWEFIKAGWRGIVEAATATWEGIKSGVQAAWDFIKTAFTEGWEFIKSGWQAVIEGAAAAWEAVKSGVGQAWEGIKAAVLTAFEGIKTGLLAAAEGLGVIWDKVKSAATVAFDAIAATAATLAQRIGSALSGAVQVITAPFRLIVQSVTDTFNRVVAAAGTLGERIAALVDIGRLLGQNVDVVSRLVAPFVAADLRIRQVWGALIQFLTSSLQAVNVDVSTKLVQPFMAADQQIRQVMSTLTQFILQSLQQTATQVVSAWQPVGQVFVQLADQIVKAMARALESIQRVIDAAKKAAFSVSEVGTAGGDGRFARGGRVRGGGTSTSDSIPAWLSRGEFVVNARATERYLPVLHAINSMRFRLPKFSMGGIVDSLSSSLRGLAIPRMASGGLPDLAPAGGGMRPLSITFDTGRGRRTFAGLQAPASVARELERAAIVEGYTRAGVAPSWDR